MRLTVILNESEARALQRAANLDLRHPRDQVRTILRDALERAGHLARVGQIEAGGASRCDSH